jgi:raffinose/stachyose/melibiose transport system permease protein
MSLLVASTWYYFGFNMILFMAGLASIPSEYYDAVKIETNRWFDAVRYVTLPMLREVLLIAFVLNISGSFGHLIGLFYLLTAGGPANRTELIGILMHNSAFVGSRYGYASAISVVMVAIVLAVVAWPALHVARERLEY